MMTALHPGEYLKEKLLLRGWSQVEFAWILGRPVQHVNKLINGIKGITANTAHELAAALDTTASFWMRLDSAHKLYLSDKKNPDLTAAIVQRLGLEESK